MIETTTVRQELMSRLARLNELAPDMRFGQLIANLTFLAAGPWDKALWDIDDERLLAAAAKMENDLSNNVASSNT